MPNEHGSTAPGLFSHIWVPCPSADVHPSTQADSSDLIRRAWESRYSPPVPCLSRISPLCPESCPTFVTICRYTPNLALGPYFGPAHWRPKAAGALMLAADCGGRYESDPGRAAAHSRISSRVVCEGGALVEASNCSKPNSRIRPSVSALPKP